MSSLTLVGRVTDGACSFGRLHANVCLSARRSWRCCSRMQGSSLIARSDRKEKKVGNGSTRQTTSGKQTAAKASKQEARTVGSRSPPTPPPPTRSKSTEQPSLSDSLARFDGALVFGDIWIVAVTHLSCGLTQLAVVAGACWVATALLRGDYTSAERLSEEGSWVHGWSVYQGILQGCFTWLFCTPVLLLVYSGMLSQGWMDPEPVMHAIEGAKVSPALGVIVALLITMSSWRGLYYALREGIL